MELGDWVGIAAIIVPIGYTWWVDRSSKKAVAEADARAERQAQATQDIARSAEEAGKHALQAQQSADDMNRSFTEMARSLAEIAKAQSSTRVGPERWGQFSSIPPSPALAPRWNIERGAKDSYVLRNVGSSPATHVSVSGLSPDVITRNLPDGTLSLGPVEGHRLLLVPTMQSGGLPPSVTVTCDELGPVTVALPPR